MKKLLLTVFAVVLLAVFVSVFLPTFTIDREDQREAQTKNILVMLRNGTRLYASTYGHYPTVDPTNFYYLLCGENLQNQNPLRKRFIVPPQWVKLDSMGRVLDGWGHPLHIVAGRTENEKIHLYSVGENGIDEGGHGDDIKL